MLKRFRLQTADLSTLSEALGDRTFMLLPNHGGRNSTCFVNVMAGSLGEMKHALAVKTGLVRFHEQTMRSDDSTGAVDHALASVKWTAAFHVAEDTFAAASALFQTAIVVVRFSLDSNERMTRYVYGMAPASKPFNEWPLIVAINHSNMHWERLIPVGIDAAQPSSEVILQEALQRLPLALTAVNTAKELAAEAPEVFDALREASETWKHALGVVVKTHVTSEAAQQDEGGNLITTFSFDAIGNTADDVALLKSLGIKAVDAPRNTTGADPGDGSAHLRRSTRNPRSSKQT